MDLIWLEPSPWAIGKLLSAAGILSFGLFVLGKKGRSSVGFSFFLVTGACT
ncbi:MAG: hypothetical protein HY549_09500, partial [Elusimicrobia bacterium]|nr:hypothetical protein [Elusimicrobiota bacterium]